MSEVKGGDTYRAYELTASTGSARLNCAAKWSCAWETSGKCVEEEEEEREEEVECEAVVAISEGFVLWGWCVSEWLCVEEQKVFVWKMKR